VWADQQIAAVRDDPSARVALAERTYHGPYGRAPRHLPYRRAALSFMRWQLQRGVLAPADSDRPGSPWWRAVNERLLRDGCETVALSGDLGGRPSSRTVEQWMSFADEPNARAWYRAHNGSVVAAYLEYRDLAERENAAERFFMNVVLCRVLYAHALVAAPRLSLAANVRPERSQISTVRAPDRPRRPARPRAAPPRSYRPARLRGGGLIRMMRCPGEG
jgi:hypothetical protein